MNIATAVTNDDQLLVERRTESCKIVRFRARETFSIIAEALSSGTIDESLEADLREDAFRRLVT